MLAHFSSFSLYLPSWLFENLASVLYQLLHIQLQCWRKLSWFLRLAWWFLYFSQCQNFFLKLEPVSLSGCMNLLHRWRTVLGEYYNDIDNEQIKQWVLPQLSELWYWYFYISNKSINNNAASLKQKVFFWEQGILGVSSFMFMISTYMKTNCIFSLSSFPTKGTSVSHGRILEMFWLNMTEGLVPAGSSKLTNSTGEHLPVHVFQYQGHDLLLSCSYGVWNLFSSYFRKRSKAG